MAFYAVRCAVFALYRSGKSFFKMESDRAIDPAFNSDSTGLIHPTRLDSDGMLAVIADRFSPLSATETHADLSRNFE